MTAIPERRRRRTVFGVVGALVLFALASTMFGVGIVTLANSKEGEAVGVDERPQVNFPDTPNALLAVEDDDGQLASLVVMTLTPEGRGGSIVPIPVNADSTGGFGLQRRPIDASFDPADVSELTDAVEEMLSISIQRSEVVDAAGLASLLETPDSIQVDLPENVVDADGSIVEPAGSQTLTLAKATEVLVASDPTQPRASTHSTDVAIWEALAATAPVSVSATVSTDAVVAPTAPDTASDLLVRLFQGDVGVRDIATVAVTEEENPTDADVVLLDRRDSTLVFAQVSPALVSTPNTGLKVRIVANFTDEDIASTDGLYDSTTDLAIELIGRLLFLSGNVVSVDTAPTGPPDITVIEVADEQWIESSKEAAGQFFGPAEVRLADTVLEGVDIQVTLGRSYLEYEMGRGRSVPDSELEFPGSSLPVDTTDPTGTVEGDG